MVVRVLFQGAYTTLEDKDDIEHYTKLNECGVCRLGQCMCDGVTDTQHKIVPAAKHLLTFGKDYASPAIQARINADTAAFCAEMQLIVEKGHKGKED